MADSGYAGLLGPFSASDEYSAQWFLISQILGRQCTAELVKVIKVHGAGGPGNPPPTVDVQPMVHMVDGSGAIVPHGVIPGVPSFRLQAGVSAVIMDPKAGDIGLCV